MATARTKTGTQPYGLDNHSSAATKHFDFNLKSNNYRFESKE